MRPFNEKEYIHMITETKRLYMRELCRDDFNELCEILQDKDVMYAYEHAFDDKEVQEWLEKQLRRYDEHGFGLWAVILKDSGAFIGQCGLTVQDFNGTDVVEIGYLFKKAYWHNGYATEAAAACKKYAFETLKVRRVYSIIRDNNIPSQMVAKRNGMTAVGRLDKFYYNMHMPHTVYSINDSEYYDSLSEN